MRKPKPRTPQEELEEFCDNIRPGRFAYLGPLFIVKDGNNIFGFLVLSALVQDAENLPLPSQKQATTRLFRDTVLAVYRANGLFITKEILAVISAERNINIAPALNNGGIALVVSRESHPALKEKEITLPIDIGSFNEFQEITL